MLDGVTGSGKTEVYFEAIAEIIRRGKQTLILMPEIALTGQFLDQFAERFGVRPLEWRSELTPRTRARNWAAISAGEAPVVVGARSALFLPYADLGLIIVDEEHDQAYKQDDERSIITPATWRWCGRIQRENPDHPRVGDAVDRS